MRIFLLSIILFFMFSCSIQNIKYNRTKIIEKYSNNYSVFVDNEIVHFGTIYLDKNNIKDIEIDKKSKKIKITQIKKVELLELKNLNLDRLSSGRRPLDSKMIGSIVLNGILVTDSLKQKIKIDPNAIKSFSILTNDKLNSIVSCRRHDKDFLVIITK